MDNKRLNIIMAFIAEESSKTKQVKIRMEPKFQKRMFGVKNGPGTTFGCTRISDFVIAVYPSSIGAHYALTRGDRGWLQFRPTVRLPIMEDVGCGIPLRAVEKIPGHPVILVYLLKGKVIPGGEAVNEPRSEPWTPFWTPDLQDILK